LAVVATPPVSGLLLDATLLPDPGPWLVLAGIDATGALLVRPDQHVAWRSPSGVSDPAAAIVAAFGEVLQSD
jgi:hypothetical protein